MPRTRSLAWSELKLGVVGLVTAVLVVTLVFAVGGQGGFFWQHYPLKARFQSINGLKEGAVVRLAGKDVGRVKRIDFAGRDLDVVLQVSKDVRPLVTTDSTVSIGALSLLGEPIVDLTASDEGTPLEDWAYVPSGDRGGIFGSSHGTVGKLMNDDELYNRMNDLTMRIDSIATGLDKGKGSAGRFLHDDRLYENMNKTMLELHGLVADIRKDPKKFLRVGFSLF